MELNGYRLLLPEGTLDYFDLVDVKESVNEVVIYLEEKNIVPEKYTDQDTESKGFYDPVIVQDFPLRGKKVFLKVCGGFPPHTGPACLRLAHGEKVILRMTR